jgi:hypothetical protein
MPQPRDLRRVFDNRTGRAGIALACNQQDKIERVGGILLGQSSKRGVEIGQVERADRRVSALRTARGGNLIQALIIAAP